MILVGSTARNLGKTALASRVIEALRPREKVIGVKVTTIRDKGEICPRGLDGCGTCSSLTGNYEILEERDPYGDKDTSQLLKHTPGQLPSIALPLMRWQHLFYERALREEP